MAALVYFKKKDEGSDTIVYIFGEDPSEMTRNLTMNKGTRRSQPGDGNIDYSFLKASRKINSMYQETSQWPERGMSVS